MDTGKSGILSETRVSYLVTSRRILPMIGTASRTPLAYEKFKATSSVIQISHLRWLIIKIKEIISEDIDALEMRCGRANVHFTTLASDPHLQLRPLFNSDKSSGCLG